MGFDLEEFKQKRPYLYHLTAASNIARIRESRRLMSASSLLQEAGQMEHNSRRRVGLLKISIGQSEVLLRDQDPLHERNIAFEDGWDLPRLIEMLNERVFFWPGSVDGPDKYGRNHFARYQQLGEEICILRVPTSSLMDANPNTPPQFCRYNSGAPGWRGGPKSPRGSATFQEASACSFPRGDIKEVTFLGHVLLPPDAEISDGGSEIWSLL